MVGAAAPPRRPVVVRHVPGSPSLPRWLCAAPQGFGDALLTYENEAVFTNLVVPERERLPFFSPDNNVRVSSAVPGTNGKV